MKTGNKIGYIYLKKIPRKFLNILINYRMFFNHLSYNVAIIQTFFGEFDIERTFLHIGAFLVLKNVLPMSNTSKNGWIIPS